MVPGTTRVVLWARRLPEGVAYQPGMSPNGEGEVSSVFDTATGEYFVSGLFWGGA